jgi:hypothetical protein
VAGLLWAAFVVIYPLTRLRVDPDKQTTWLILVLALAVSVLALVHWLAHLVAINTRAIAELRSILTAGRGIVLHPTPVGYGADRSTLQAAIGSAAIPSSTTTYVPQAERERTVELVGIGTSARPAPVMPTQRWEQPSGGQAVLGPAYYQAYGDVAETVLATRDDDPPAGAHSVQ